MSPTPEMRRWRFVTIAWCFAMCLAFAFIVFGATFYYVQRSSDRLESARKHSDQQFSKALIVTDRKFRQALRITNAQSAYSINKSVCGFRKLVIPTLATYKQAAEDPSLSASAKARNAGRIKSTQDFLDTQVTVPSDFDCTKLPRRAP